MFKCRYCPHVNLRKVNIQEHEKMHSTRDKNPKNDVDHRCNECNYVCNNAGVLSSHSKVHQGLYGVVHCLVDFTKPDEEQIKELTKALEGVIDTSEFLEVEMEEVDTSLYFCKYCPARFLKENEFDIHKNFHSSDLLYKCDFCSYAADNESYLLSHLKVHSVEYLERTKILKSYHVVSPNHPEPDVKPQTVSAGGETVWGVDATGKSELEQKNNILASFLSKPLKSSVPLSGTDLFQQRSEAQQRQTSKESLNIEAFIQGNPEFIYQTYVKNGRTKEKRYKCHKCPSAFEKREQYKIHLGLHGSQQRYNCEHCDYSVKYYANYVQHLKKHKFNDDAQAAKKSSVDDTEESIEEKKSYWCQYCPYVNGRRDALENHLKRHGAKSTYACDHCDYSVPQAHFLRDHAKLHFIPNKSNHVDGYMICDNLKLTSTDENVIYEEGNVEEEDEEKFNNNKGENRLVNVQTGDLVIKQDISDLN